MTRRADPDASRNAPTANFTTLRWVYETVYLPRREERKGAVPRRRSRLDQEKAITRFVEMIGDKPIATITRGDAERFVRGLRVGSTATVKKTVTSLSTICNSASRVRPDHDEPVPGTGAGSDGHHGISTQLSSLRP